MEILFAFGGIILILKLLFGWDYSPSIWAILLSAILASALIFPTETFAVFFAIGYFITH